MNNTITIVLEKLLDFHVFMEGFYDSLLKAEHILGNYAMKNTAVILKSLETKHCGLYRKSIEINSRYKTPVSGNILSEVDFSLITLKQSLNSYGIMDAKQMIANAIDCENKQIFLLGKIIDMISQEIQENEPIEVMKMLKEEEESNLRLLTPFI